VYTPTPVYNVDPNQTNTNITSGSSGQPSNSGTVVNLQGSGSTSSYSWPN